MFFINYLTFAYFCQFSWRHDFIYTMNTEQTNNNIFLCIIFISRRKISFRYGFRQVWNRIVFWGKPNNFCVYKSHILILFHFEIYFVYVSFKEIRKCRSRIYSFIQNIPKIVVKLKLRDVGQCLNKEKPKWNILIIWAVT